MLRGVQGDLVLAHRFGEAVAPQLAGVVAGQLVVDLMPGAQHGLLVSQSRFLLLGLAQVEHALQAATVEQRQAQRRAEGKGA